MSSSRHYLLDTNIVSETLRPRPEPRVLQFLSEQDSAALFISALTLGELRKGVASKARTDAAAAERLKLWVDGLERSFADRIVSIDAAVANLWGVLSGSGRSRPVIDTLMAATALHHGWTLVTRNTHDVADTGVSLLNPWAA